MNVFINKENEVAELVIKLRHYLAPEKFAKLRAIEGAQWDKEIKCWVVQNTSENVNVLLEMINVEGKELDQETKASKETLMRIKAKCEPRLRRNFP